MNRLFGAIQFLTVFPVRRFTASPGDSAVCFPLVGALLGASGGVILILLPRLGFDLSLSALLVLAWFAFASGCLHEDGLADVADAVRAGRTRDKMMQILKDSRIGTYGAIALIFSIGLRWQALSQVQQHPIAGLAASLALSRASLVVLAATANPVGSGLGYAFVAACTRKTLIAVSIQSIAILALSSVLLTWRSLLMLAATILLVLLAKTYFTLRLGGVNGDCLGATCQVVEILNLVILAWQPSF